MVWLEVTQGGVASGVISCITPISRVINLVNPFFLPFIGAP